MFEMKLVLPDQLAREAEANGLLTRDAIEAMLREELRRRRTNRLFDVMEQVSNVVMPPLTESEIEAEIQAVRRSKARPSCE
jgi:hypothetical protein